MNFNIFNHFIICKAINNNDGDNYEKINQRIRRNEFSNNDLNELAKEDIIYEESQTGPQEEPTLKEIQLELKSIKKKMKFNN